jgi:hypothetical protein
MGYTLWLHWEWLSRTEPERLWASLPSKEERVVHAMFQASVSVQVQSGAAPLFWKDRWLQGDSMEHLYPDLVACVPGRIKKSHTVAEALQNLRWVRDISDSLSATVLVQYLNAWSRLQQVQLNLDVQDKFLWKWTANQSYSAASAYRAFFHGQCFIPGAQILCKTKAIPRCKFFIWLSLLDRC